MTVFDAAGTDACQPNQPSSCTQLFRATSDLPALGTRPTIANNRLLLPSSKGARVFDAAGIQSCSAGVCQPLYELAMPSAGPVEPVVANGRTYAISTRTLAAFDIAGVAGCGGAPRICQPVWSAPSSAYGGRPVVTDQRIFVRGTGTDGGAGVEVYDANGIAGCTGNPAVCSQLWQIPGSELPGDFAGGMAASAPLLVLTGATLPDSPPFSTSPTVRFYDLAGKVGCSGTPVECHTLRSIALPQGTVFLDSPAIAFGRVAIGSYVGTTVLGLPG